MVSEDSDPIFFESAEDALAASGEVGPQQRKDWLGWLAAKEAFESRDEDSDPRQAAADFFAQPPPEPATPEQAANWLGWLADKHEFESQDEDSGIDMGQIAQARSSEPRRARPSGRRPKPPGRQPGPPSPKPKRPPRPSGRPARGQPKPTGRPPRPRPTTRKPKPKPKPREQEIRAGGAPRKRAAPARNEQEIRAANARRLLGRMPKSDVAEILAQGHALRRSRPNVPRGRLGKHLLEELLERAKSLSIGQGGAVASSAAVARFQAALEAMFAEEEQAGDDAYGTSLEDIERVLLDLFDKLQQAGSTHEQAQMWIAEADKAAPAAPDPHVSGLELAPPSLPRQTPPPAPVPDATVDVMRSFSFGIVPGQPTPGHPPGPPPAAYPPAGPPPAAYPPAGPPQDLPVVRPTVSGLHPTWAPDLGAFAHLDPFAGESGEVDPPDEGWDALAEALEAPTSPGPAPPVRAPGGTNLAPYQPPQGANPNAPYTGGPVAPFPTGQRPPAPPPPTGTPYQGGPVPPWGSSTSGPPPPGRIEDSGEDFNPFAPGWTGG